MTRQQGLEIAVPLIHEIQTALLHPFVEISRRYLIRIMKNWVIRRQNLNGRLFDRNAGPAELRWVGGEMAAVEVAHSSVVLGNQSSAGSHVFERPLIICHDILLCVVGANAKHDR